MFSSFYDRILRYKVIIKNAGYLSVIEALRLIMPFVALPYVIYTVGAENYGLAVFVQTIVKYFMIVINWGLDVSAVKDVSVNRDSIRKLNEIVSSVYLIKFLIFILCYLLLFVGIYFIPFAREHQLLFHFAFITCIADVLYPAWFYMGLEKMKYVTIIKSVSIFFYVGTVFVFVREASDYDNMVLLQSLGNILSSLLAVWLLFKVNKVRLVIPHFKDVQVMFIESFPFFVSRLSCLFNEAVAKTVSGIIFPMQYVTALDLGSKVSSAGLIPMQMMNQSVYPHIANTKDVNFVNKYFRINILFSFGVALAMFFLAPIGVPILAGGEMALAVELTQIYSLYTFIGGMCIYVGAPVLVSFGYSKPFNLSVIYSSLLLCCIYMVMYLLNIQSIYGFVFALCVAELFCLVYRVYYCRKFKIIKL